MRHITTFSEIGALLGMSHSRNINCIGSTTGGFMSNCVFMFYDVFKLEKNPQHYSTKPVHQRYSHRPLPARLRLS